MGAFALVAGILSLLSSTIGGAFSLGWVGSILGVFAIIFGAISAKRSKAGKVGMIFGIIALTWGIIATIVCAICIGASAAAIDFSSLY